MVYRTNNSIHYSFNFGIIYRNGNDKWLQRNKCSYYSVSKFCSVTANSYSKRTNNILFGGLGNIDFVNWRFISLVDR